MAHGLEKQDPGVPSLMMVTCCGPKRQQGSGVNGGDPQQELQARQETTQRIAGSLPFWNEELRAEL